MVPILQEAHPRSAALEAGLSVKDIMNVADWSNASTFKKFYNKVNGSSDVSFGKTILQSTSVTVALKF